MSFLRDVILFYDAAPSICRTTLLLLHQHQQVVLEDDPFAVALIVPFNCVLDAVHGFHNYNHGWGTGPQTAYPFYPTHTLALALLSSVLNNDDDQHGMFIFPPLDVILESVMLNDTENRVCTYTTTPSFVDGYSMYFTPMEDNTKHTVTCIACTTHKERLHVFVGSDTGLSCYDPKVSIPRRRWFWPVSSGGVREMEATMDGLVVVSMDWVVYVVRADEWDSLRTPHFELALDTKCIATDLGLSVVRAVTSPYGSFEYGVTVATLYSDNTVNAHVVEISKETKVLTTTLIATERITLPSGINYGVENVTCMATSGYWDSSAPKSRCFIDVGYVTGSFLMVSCQDPTSPLCFDRYSQTPVTCLHISPDYSLLAVTASYDEVLMMDQVEFKQLYTVTYAKGPKEIIREFPEPPQILESSKLDLWKLSRRQLRFHPSRYEIVNQYGEWFIRFNLEVKTESAERHCRDITLFAIHTEGQYVCMYDEGHAITLYRLN